MRDIKLFLLFIILITESILIFPGCESTNDPSDTGTLLVKITDDPFPVDLAASAAVFINKIELRKKDDSEGNPFRIIAETEEPMEFDLLDLQNGVTAELPKIEIDAGAYDLVRLYVESAKILLNDGQEFNLNVPSGAETGIKIFIDPELLIQGGLTSELLLDFDLSNSFIAQGSLSSPSGIKGFKFQPVIRAVNNQLAGSIHGTIADADGRLGGVLVTATLDGESATALTDENGYYEIIGLKEGLYSVNAYKQGYNLLEKFDINIAANTESEIDFILIKGI